MKLEWRPLTEKYAYGYALFVGSLTVAVATIGTPVVSKGQPTRWAPFYRLAGLSDRSAKRFDTAEECQAFTERSVLAWFSKANAPALPAELTERQTYDATR